MALTACSECDGRVASTAAACPHCGNPMPGDPLEQLAAAKPGQRRGARRPGVQTIEQTSKTWKAHMLLGAAMGIAGVVLAVAAMQGARPDKSLAMAGAVVGGLGFLWFLAAHIAAWWHHG